MKKKSIVGFILFLIVIIISSKEIFAVESEIEVDLYKFTSAFINDNAVDIQEKQRVLDTLKTTFGYTGSDIVQGANTMKFETRIFLLESYETGVFNKSTKYKIQIGGGAKDSTGKTGVVVKDIDEKELVDKYGYEKKGKSINTDDPPWDVVLIGQISTKTRGRDEQFFDEYIVAKKLYSGKDYQKGKQVQLDEGKSIQEVDVITDRDVVDAVKDFIDELEDIANIFGHLVIKLIEFKRLPFDALQSLIDMLQTVNYDGPTWFLPWNITYKKDDLLKDQNKNQYTNYTEGTTNLGSQGQKRIFVNEEDFGLDITLLGKVLFDSEPQIPVIPVDIYAMAKRKVDIFDINFLNGQNNTDVHKSGSAWLILRNFISALIHVTIYIGAAILICILVWHGISIVLKVFLLKDEEETPEERKGHIDGLHKFVQSLLLLIGSVIIMGLFIFVSDAFFEDMKVTNTMELPIRVNVGERK